MHILFVCSGNICRSPMGELLMKRYLQSTNIFVSSAGTIGLPSHPIAAHSAEMLNLVNIDSSAFRSRRLTKQIAESADLILCYEKKHCAAVSQLAPAKMRQTFLLPDFANLCQYCSQAGMLDRYYTVESRIRAVIASAFTVRPMVSVAEDISDSKAYIGSCFSQSHYLSDLMFKFFLSNVRAEYNELVTAHTIYLIFTKGYFQQGSRF